MWPDFLRRTYSWRAWEWIRWGAPWLLAGLAIGAVAVAIVNVCIPLPPVNP